jgi:signal transduction histidine kinase
MPLGSRTVLIGVTVLILFLGLSAGSFLSLVSVRRDAEDAREELTKLDLLDQLESFCGGTGPVVDPAACERTRAAARSLAGRGWRPVERASLERVLGLCARQGSTGQAPAAEELRAAIASLRRAILSRINEEIRATGEPAYRRAFRLLYAALAFAVGTSLVFAWTFRRLIRERRALTDRLVRSEKLSALATLAAGISHELNNPLATIAMSAEALASRLPGSSEEARYAAAVEEEVERCRTIIADLSDLARGATLDPGPVDPGEVAREAVRIVARHLDDPATRIGTDLATGLPLIRADRGKLRQLLVNLLQNAVDASGPEGRVWLTIRRTAGRLSISVRDEGRGIPPHLLDRIFEPFFTDKSKGVGLGLTICHRIAELHGGELTAASDGPGRGSTFTFSLPLEASRG